MKQFKDSGTSTHHVMLQRGFVSHSARRGFVLPTVMVTTLMIALLAASLQAAVWRATRNARLGFAGERALHAADAAVAQQLAAWDNRAFASMSVGARSQFAAVLPMGLSATVTLARTSLENAVIEAVATSAQNGASINAQRRVTRMLAFRNPPLPLENPLTLLGTASFAGAGTVSLVDETPPGWSSDCAQADSLDARNVSVANAAASRTLFDGHWSEWLARASRLEDGASVTTLAPIVTAGGCAPGAGDPLRGGGSVAACTNEWGARAVSNASPFTVSANSRYQGVLLVDGDLTLTNNLDVYGLLIVRGAVDASVGRLQVYGAALVRDDLGHGSRFGIASRVRYSRCALRRALSATGAPVAITSRGWLERF